MVCIFGLAACQAGGRNKYLGPKMLYRLCSTVWAPFYGQRQGEVGSEVEDVNGTLR
jgi:hypothetical protein